MQYGFSDLFFHRIVCFSLTHILTLNLMNLCYVLCWLLHNNQLFLRSGKFEHQLFLEPNYKLQNKLQI